MVRINLLVVLCLITGACTQKPNTQGKPLIVCTTGIIADGIRNMSGSDFEVKELMGPGVDPHLYKASQGDIVLLESADLIFYNGLHLEGKMGEVLEKLGRKKKVVAVADGVKKDSLRQMQEQEGTYDPHIWFDVVLWTQAMQFAGDKLAEKFSQHSDSILHRKNQYVVKLENLNTSVIEKLREVPSAQRVLVTAHDAFGYFGMRYSFEVKGLQGISTISEFGLKEVTEMVDFLVDRKIKSVFVETSVPEKYIRSVVEGCASKGHIILIGGTLFSDAMGDKGTPEGHYEGMVLSNVQKIVEGLK